MAYYLVTFIVVTGSSMITLGFSQPAEALCISGYCSIEPHGLDRKPHYSILPSYDRSEIVRKIRRTYRFEHGHGPVVVSARLSETRTRIPPGMTDYRELRTVYAGPPVGRATQIEFTTSDGLTYHQLWDVAPSPSYGISERLAFARAGKLDIMIDPKDATKNMTWQQFDPVTTTLADDRGTWGKPILNPEPLWVPFPELVTP